MAITNGYATLAEAKERIMDASRYTAATISFVSGTKTIADSAKGLRRFGSGDYVTVSGSTSNNSTFTIVTGNSPASFTVSETVTGENAGATVTLTKVIDPMDNLVIESIVEAVSRWIEAYTGRRFYRNSEDESRYYTATHSFSLETDDIGSLTTLATDDDGDRTYETTWAATDYDLMPYNATVSGQPYTWLDVTPSGNYAFPTTARGVKLTGKFGYAASTPAPIKEACLLMTERLFRRRDAIFGVLGSAETGMITITQADSDVKMLLLPYVRLGVRGF